MMIAAKETRGHHQKAYDFRISSVFHADRAQLNKDVTENVIIKNRLDIKINLVFV